MKAVHLGNVHLQLEEQLGPDWEGEVRVCVNCEDNVIRSTE